MATAPTSQTRKTPDLATILFVSIIIVLVVLAMIHFSRPRDQDSSTKANWYEGGSLHKSTLGEWGRATDANRLATAADYVVNYARQINKPFNEIEDVRDPAEELVNCINEVATAGELASQPTTDIAISCMKIMFTE